MSQTRPTMGEDTGIGSSTLGAPSAIRSDLQCGICSNQLQAPVQSTCGMRFCRRCVEQKFMGVDEILCPCGETECPPVTYDKFYKDTWAEKEIKKKRGATTILYQTPAHQTGGVAVGGRPRPPEGDTLAARRTRQPAEGDTVTAGPTSRPAEKPAVLRTAKEQAEVEQLERQLKKLENIFKAQSDALMKLQTCSVIHEKRIKALEEECLSFATKGQLIAQERQLEGLRSAMAVVENGLNRNLTVPCPPPRHTLPNVTGHLIWRIDDLSRRRQEAQEGAPLSITSEPFFTSVHGYALRMRAYLDGTGSGRGQYLALYLVIEKGEYDALLAWPFKQRVTFSVKAQHVNGDMACDIVRVLSHNTGDPGCQRPTDAMNQGIGIEKFCLLTNLDNPVFTDNGTLFVKAAVEKTDL